jgi:hypothetical protein
MKIISLSASYRGYACSVASNIKEKYYKGNFEANLFDILLVSMKSINQFFNYNIEELELEENFEIPIWKTTDESEFYFRKFDMVLSTHLLKKKYTNYEYNDIINKYKRRYYRFFNNIKNEDKIYFISNGIEKEEEILEFINNVKKYNPKLKFKIIILFCDKKHKYKLKNKNFKPYNFYKTLDKKFEYSSDTYYRLKEYNWLPIFNYIEKKTFWKKILKKIGVRYS